MTLFEGDRPYRIYIYLLLFSVLLPNFSAIDNNPIRWLSLSLLVFIYYSISLYLNAKDFVVNKTINWAIFILIVCITLSLLNSSNIVESFIPFIKLIILVIAFISLLISLTKISKPHVFISKAFIISILIESIYTVTDFLISEIGFTGISMNRNISAFSIVLKLPLLIYLYTKLTKNKNILKIIEIIAIISIIILQSRAAIFSLFFIYFFALFFKHQKKLSSVISILFSLGFLLFFLNNTSNLTSEKFFNTFNLEQDQSYNQRISYFINSVNLFKEKPIFGHGIGTWKIESLKNSIDSSSNVIIPYYVHNDFLQMLMETGIIGFITYIIIFILIVINLLKIFNRHTINKYLLLSIIIFIIDSSLNFPIHRSQVVIPFVLIVALSLTRQNVVSSNNSMSKTFSIILLIPISLSIFSNTKEFNSLIYQDKLLSDYYSNTLTIEDEVLDKIDYRYPQLSSNTIPVATYLARYSIGKKDYDQAITFLEYSIKSNPYDKLSKELMLQAFLFNSNFDKALLLARELHQQDINNVIYAEVYFSIASDFNLSSELINSNIITKSNNSKIHKLFYENLLKLKGFDKDKLLMLIQKSILKFPNDNYFKNILLTND